VVVVFLVLDLTQRALLPVYHDRFALRRQVESALQHEPEALLPIVSYPKRWDSISFYSQRDDVASYTSIEPLLHDLQAYDRALIFIQREKPLMDFLQNRLARMEIEWCGQGGNAVVAIVRQRKD
jgi:hypothetical protein